MAGADTPEPISEADYRVTAGIMVTVMPLLALGNVLSRGVVAADARSNLPAYDAFLRLNLPCNALVILIGAWMLLGRRSERACRIAIHLALTSALITGTSGLWLRGSLTNALSIILIAAAIAVVRVYLDWRLGLFALLMAMAMHSLLVVLETAGVIQSHALHPHLDLVEYASTSFMLATLAWILLIYVVVWVFASYVARRFRVGEQALRELNMSLEQKVSDQVTHIERVNRLRRYMAPQVVEHMLESEVDPSDMRERRTISVLFADLRGFTQLVETLDPGELDEMLNKYFDEVTTAAFAHGGTIDKFIGDAVMMLFGAPQSTGEQDQALRCVKTAVEIQQRLREINLVARIGIGTGEATVGSFGSAQRTEFTAVGVTVNRAARLEPLAPSGAVLVDERTQELAGDVFTMKLFGELELKGFGKPVRAYEVGTQPVAEGSTTS